MKKRQGAALSTIGTEERELGGDIEEQMSTIAPSAIQRRAALRRAVAINQHFDDELAAPMN
jgi:hypothetical protein